MHTKKSLGQHFLMHARIAERIADTAGLIKEDVALEIGPGTGILTRALLVRVKKIIAVEADGALVRGLQEKFAGEIALGQLELVHADIRTYSIFHAIASNMEYKIVANIPYYLTGEILRMFLSAERQPSSMTLLVQKEVGERIARSKKESLLSLSVKAYGTPKYAFTVPRGAFAPAPNVDSAVITIRDISRKNFVGAEHEERFFAYLRAGFGQKRKKLAKNLQEAELPAPKNLENTRAEDVPIADWLTFTRNP
jgi:16S rRNA (adenine1518-N6/adenine1519-N6)-dimethyltransferase